MKSFASKLAPTGFAYSLWSELAREEAI